MTMTMTSPSLLFLRNKKLRNSVAEVKNVHIENEDNQIGYIERDGIRGGESGIGRIENGGNEDRQSEGDSIENGGSENAENGIGENSGILTLFCHCFNNFLLQCRFIGDSLMVDSVLPTENGDGIENIQTVASVARDLTSNENGNLDTANETHVLPQIKLEETNENTIEGRRIIEIEYFLNQLRDMSNHNNGNCSFDDLIPQKEIRRGLFSKIIFRCQSCHQSFDILTNEDEKTTRTLSINCAAVLATNMIGIGYSQFEQFASIIDVPVMGADKYKSLNDQMGKLWEATSEESMKKAAEEERQAAIERGDVDAEDGIPWITVITDASWSKRSYNKNYSALSGVAAIVGAYTGKVLWIGVKNKYCVTCVRHGNKNQVPPPHICTRNFIGASSEMEWQALLEGFQSSVEMYNMRYMKLIADGDSSTHPKLIAHKPYQHRYIQKIECTNHLFRNYRKQMEKASKGCPAGMKKVIDGSLDRIRKDIVCAVTYRKQQETTHSEKLASLKSDIENVIHHVFGNHENCPDYIKKHCKHDDKNYIPALIASGTVEKMMLPTRRLMYCADDLLKGETNNPAEHYNSIVAKFVGGKRVNFSLSNNYKYKATAATVQFNTKKALSAFYETNFHTKPSPLAKKIESKRLQKCNREKARRIKMKALKIVRKRFKSVKDTGSAYGEDCEKLSLSEDKFENEKRIYIEKITKNQANREMIEKETHDKHKSRLWQEVSPTLLIASNFGSICKARVLSSHVKELTNATHAETKAMKHENESLPTALIQLASEQNMNIQNCGLFIDAELICLAASPSGIVSSSDMIVEIKCPLAILNKDPCDPKVLGKHAICISLKVDQISEIAVTLAILNDIP